MTKYRIFDLNKGLFSNDTYITAKSPLEAVREYAITQGKDTKTIARDYTGTRGNYVVYGNRKSFVYEERK